MHESEKRLPPEVLLQISTAMGLFFIALGAFSRGSKERIHRRDGFMCVKCGASESLEASHRNHTKNENYDKPSNGDTLCTSCHLEYHIDTVGKNGLNISQNEWAIKMLRKRLW